MTILARQDRPEEPPGCLGCNEDAVRKWFRSIGVTDKHMSQMHRVNDPDWTTEHNAWANTVVCGKCGQAWQWINETVQ